MKKMILAAAMTIGASSATMASADCGDVSITEMDWASSAVVTAVATFLMEQGYGCSVQLVPSSTTPALTSLAETGEPDILTEVWANSTPSYQPLVDAGKLVEVANVLSDGGVEAWWIPAYLAGSNPELTTWEGIMANPSAVGGKFHDCPSGWACDIINNNNLKALAPKLADLSVSNMVLVRLCRHPLRLRMLKKRHGLDITGPQQLFWVNIRWFAWKCLHTTLRHMPAMVMLIAQTQCSLPIPRQKSQLRFLGLLQKENLTSSSCYQNYPSQIHRWVKYWHGVWTTMHLTMKLLFISW